MEGHISRDYKDRLFSFIFGKTENRAWTLSLYNAVNGTAYEDPNEIEITTIGDAVYMGMKDDVSFMIECSINLYEQQSSFNPNMPVRQLMYIAKLYDKLIKKTRQNIYGSKLMTLPMPKLVTFYNGPREVEDRVLNLSDSFPKGCNPSESDVEVKVHMINIRPEHKSAVLNGCKVLSEYSWFVEAVRNNRKSMENSEAVDKALKDMPDDYELKDFLLVNKAEVKDMCLTEYDEAETMQMFKEEGIEEGGDIRDRERIIYMLKKGKTIDEIVDFCGYEKELVEEVDRELKATV